MKTFRSLLALVMALCLALGASCALADQTMEGDANVDQRYYPAVTPFIHPPFYNVKLAVEVDDHGVITNVSDNGTGGAAGGSEGAGMGLQAMDDRVRALGGTLRTGRQQDRGFRVFASIPK